MVGGVSTALSMAVQRAAHRHIDPPPHIVDDSVGWRLLSNDERALIEKRPYLFANGIARTLRVRALVRQRYAEQALRDAVRRGASQYVILGAGMDSFALRQPDWAASLRIFEVDRAEEQARKRMRVASGGFTLPPNLTMIEADFDCVDLLETLMRGGFDPDLPSFIACLGVLVYLSPHGIEQVLGLARRMSGPAEMVFTVAMPAKNGADALIARYAAAAGEPWRNLFEGDDMVERLRVLGYDQVTQAPPEVLVARLDAAAAALVRVDSTILFKVTT